MAEVKLKEETELWEPRGPCGSWGPAEDAHRSGVERAHLKEEPELCIKQEPQEFPFHMVTVKTEDDEDKSSVLHQRPTEENRKETNGWDCGAEAGCSSDPLTQFHSDSEEEEHTDSSEDTDHSEDYSQEQAPAKRSYAMIPPDATVRDKRPHSCPECGKSFPSHHRLKRHMLAHSEERPHKCLVCEKYFKEMNKLKVHMTTHSGEKPHVCPVCKRTFAFISSLCRHQKHIHHMCPVCKESFANRTKQTEHLKTHAEDGTLEQALLETKCIKRYRCTRSGTEFKEKTHLHRDTGETLLKCRVCDQGFTFGFEMNKHLRLFHRICPVCEEEFMSDSDLNKHVTGVEAVEPLCVNGGNERIFSCSECRKDFKRRSDLRRHVLVHSGEKPFKCSVCEKTFTQNSALKTHLKTHSGERPFVCSLCERTFIQKGALQRHQRTHSGERPFVCSVCEKAFTQKGALQRHQKVHSEAKRATFIRQVCDDVLV